MKTALTGPGRRRDRQVQDAAAVIADISLLDARSDAERRQRRTAILLMCATMACYSVLDTSAKWLGLRLPVTEIIWSRYLGATLVTLLIANPLRNHRLLHSERLGLQMGRSVFLLGSTVVNFIAVRHLQLAETTAINFALPLAVALAAGPVLGEWVGRRRMAAILVGFLGVLVVIGPGFGAFRPAMLLSISNIGFGAGYNMMTRIVAQRDPPLTTLTYSTLLGAVLITPAVPFFWVAPDGAVAWVLLGAIGAIGAGGHALIILAHARAPASILAPFAYTQLIWMVLSGYLLFGDVPRPATFAGAAVVVASGLYLWHRERNEKPPAT